MRRRTPPPPELQLAPRLAILGAAAVAITGMAITTGLIPQCALALALLVAGHRVSWQGRERRRTPQGQVVLAALVGLAIVYLIADLFAGAFGGNLPQAVFALAAMAITSLDLKSRRNLYSHLWHSLVLLYIGGLFAWSVIYLGVVLAWGAAMCVFLTTTRRVASASGSQRRQRPRRSWMAAWAGISVLVFIAMPELTGRPLAAPLMASVPAAATHGGEALPSELPLIGSATPPGGGNIDLRARGQLGDEVAFHVRANAPSYWRSYALDSYTGQSWTRDPQATSSSVDAELGLPFTEPDESPASDHGEETFSQTFFIDSPLSNEVISAYPVQSVYFPAPNLTMYANGTLEAPFALHQGVNYATVSVVRDMSAAALRTAQPITPRMTEWTSLPDTVTQRTLDLAASLSAGQPTEYDTVMNTTTYLRDHYTYSLDTPRLTDSDAVDQFLFIDREGFCEQFASTLAVMLRADGIPARLAVGYASGDHDAFTGTYTVHNSDAHAWTEVYFPGIGWLPFDASPGYSTNPMAQKDSPWFLQSGKLVSLGGVPGGAGIATAVTAFIGLLALCVWVARRRFHLARMPGPQREYVRALWWLRLAGLPGRDPTETPEEHLRRLAGVDADAAGTVAPVAGALQSWLYGDGQARGRRSPRLARLVLRHRLGL